MDASEKSRLIRQESGVSNDLNRREERRYQRCLPPFCNLLKKPCCVESRLNEVKKLAL